jgi:chemotaxis protein CheY-P-specific phosphatase CheC
MMPEKERGYEEIGYKDILKEITTIGAGHAAAVLSMIYNKPVYITVPEVKVVEVKDLPKIQPPGCRVAQSKISIAGDQKAYALMVVEKENIPLLVSKLSGPGEYKAEVTSSVISELATILFGGYFSALGNFLLQSIVFTPPVIEPIGDKFMKDIKAKGYLPSDKLLLAKSGVLVERAEEASLLLYTVYLLRTFHGMLPPLPK